MTQLNLLAIIGLAVAVMFINIVDAVKNKTWFLSDGKKK